MLIGRMRKSVLIGCMRKSVLVGMRLFNMQHRTIPLQPTELAWKKSRNITGTQGVLAVLVELSNCSLFPRAKSQGVLLHTRNHTAPSS